MPEGAKVNNGCEESQNRVKKRYFATLSMTGSAGSTAILLPFLLLYAKIMSKIFVYM